MAEYTIETITPVHVGSGQKYSKAEFILQNKVLSRISLNKLLSELSENQREGFVDALESREFSMTDFVSNNNLDISKITSYKVRCPDGLSTREVSEHIKTNHKAYIPGSSIKGAIRTAMLYKILKENYSIVDNELNRIKKDKRLMSNLNRTMNRHPAFKDKRFSRELERTMSYIEREVLRGYKNDAKYDIFRFLQVTDTSMTEKLSILTVKSIGMSQKGRSYSQIEAIGKNIIFDGSIVLKPVDLSELGLSDKAKYLNIASILNAIYIFADDLRRLEIEYAKDHQLTDITEFYTSCEFNNQPDSPYLRLGAGKGLLSNTIALLIKLNDPDFYRYLRFVAWRSYPNEFPKTRKIIFENGKPKYPLGWVKLSLK